MVNKNPECECPLGPEFEAAGVTGRLCHHSSLQSLLAAKAALDPLCEKIANSVDPATLFTMPPNKGIEYYIKQFAQEHAKAINVFQQAILTANFFRDYAILIHYAQVETLLQLKRSGAV